MESFPFPPDFIGVVVPASDVVVSRPGFLDESPISGVELGKSIMTKRKVDVSYAE